MKKERLLKRLKEIEQELLSHHYDLRKIAPVEAKSILVAAATTNRAIKVCNRLKLEDSGKFKKE